MYIPSLGFSLEFCVDWKTKKTHCDIYKIFSKNKGCIQRWSNFISLMPHAQKTGFFSKVSKALMGNWKWLWQHFSPHQLKYGVNNGFIWDSIQDMQINKWLLSLKCTHTHFDSKQSVEAEECHSIYRWNASHSRFTKKSKILSFFKNKF